jgi:dCTP deaminase
MAQEHGMISPFEAGQIRENEQGRVISYGTSSYGYDVRCADEFKVFTNINSVIVDVKNFDTSSFVDVKSDVCIIPPNSFALARTVEYFKIPRDVLVVCLGKSSYARCGIIVNVTPLEPCFSSDTQILTNRGWKHFNEIVIGTEVLTMNPETEVAEWQAVERIQAYPYIGDLLHFEGRSIDLLVTPDHSLYVDKRSNPRKNEWTGWHKEKAGDIFGKHNYRMSRQVNWQGVDIADEIKIGLRNYETNLFLKFLGLYLGDGSCYAAKKGNYIIKIAAMTDRDYQQVNDVFTRLGHKPNYDGRSWKIQSKALYEFLKPLGHAHQKYIPQWAKELPSYRLQYLLEGLLESDGNLQTGTYTTVSAQLADDVQEIMFKVGTAAIVRNVGISETKRMINGHEIVNNYPVFKVRQSTVHLKPKIMPSTHKKVPYTGMVYDVTVPNHIIFVRRNGKAVWSGNCWEGQVTLEFSNTTPLPAKIYANEGVAQMLFFGGDEVCETSYKDRGGKYQGQQGVTLPRT